MPIKVECPRCKTTMALTPARGGSLIGCPRCQYRFRVLGNGAIEQSGPELAVPPGLAPAGGRAAASAASPVAAPPPPATPPARAPAPPASGGSPAAAPAAARQGRKVARLIAADVSQSALKLAADGVLPQLRLRETGESQTKPQKPKGVHPLVLVLLPVLSLGFSALLWFVDLGPAGQSRSVSKEQARQIIQDEYFSGLQGEGHLEPYQEYLREAQQAHSRGDLKTEREMYRKVLFLLRGEHGPFEGLTGSDKTDKRLEEQITILLKD